MATEKPRLNILQSCAPALAAPELLCRILRYLEPKDLLVNGPRVCKYWKNAIDRDPEMQRSLFFMPIETETGEDGSNNDIVEAADSRIVLNPFFAEFLTPYSDEEGRRDPLNGSGFKGKAELCGLFEECDDPDIWRRPEASWRRMLPQQPPRDLVVIQKNTCLQPYDDLRYYTTKQFRGITMGDLYYLLWAYVYTSMTEGFLEEVEAEFDEESNPRGILACATRWYLMTGAGDQCSELRAPRRVDLPIVEKMILVRMQESYFRGPSRPMVLTLMDRCRDCRGHCAFCGPWMSRYGQCRSADAAVMLGFDESDRDVVEMWDDYALLRPGGGPGRTRREKKLTMRCQGWQFNFEADYSIDNFDTFSGAVALVDLDRSR